MCAPEFAATISSSHPKRAQHHGALPARQTPRATSFLARCVSSGAPQGRCLMRRPLRAQTPAAASRTMRPDRHQKRCRRGFGRFSTSVVPHDHAPVVRQISQVPADRIPAQRHLRAQHVRSPPHATATHRAATRTRTCPRRSHAERWRVSASARPGLLRGRARPRAVTAWSRMGVDGSIHGFKV